MDARENFLQLLHGGKPESLVNEWEPFGMMFDPLMARTLTAQLGQTIIDPWGISIYWGENEPGPMPIVNDKTKVCKDVTEWKKTVKAPDLETPELDWGGAIAQREQCHADGKLATTLMAIGLFELSHYLMGFEDTLMNLLAEPDDMHEFLDYLTEYKLNYCKLIVENLHPDVVLFHDDWGAKTRMFMSAEVWREFFKPRYMKIYKYLKDNGVIIMHHADSFCEPIVKDMVDIGIDIWQGALPENNIPKMQKEVEGKLIFMGGIDAQIIDHANIDEEVIRQEVRRACDEYVPGGAFVPCLTYGGPGSIFPGVDDIIKDEIKKISHKYF